MIKCPHCGESDFYKMFETMTIARKMPHYVNGKLVKEENPNKVTYHYQCAKCKQYFESDKTPADDLTITVPPEDIKKMRINANPNISVSTDETTYLKSIDETLKRIENKIGSGLPNYCAPITYC